MHSQKTVPGRSFACFDHKRAPKTCLAIFLALGLSACGGGSTDEPVTAAESGTATETATATESAFRRPRSPESAGQSSIPTTIVATSTPTAPPVASDRAPLGVNLEGLWDWARLQPFADAMKSARPWGT